MAKSEDRSAHSTLLAVRLRGPSKISRDVEDTLGMLNLQKANHGILLPNTPSTLGMLRKVKGYLAWGEPTADTIQRLLEERGELEKGAELKEAVKRLGYSSVSEVAKSISQDASVLGKLRETGLKLPFRLRPPRRGFRKSIKRLHGTDGEAGYRGGEINELIARMI